MCSEVHTLKRQLIPSHFQPGTRVRCPGSGYAARKPPKHVLMLSDEAVAELQKVYDVHECKPAKVKVKVVTGMPRPEPSPPSTELCKSGPDPVAGCVACGDLVYMAATGREGTQPPYSFEGWREEFEETGIAWAKERMRDHVTLEHRTIFDRDLANATAEEQRIAVWRHVGNSRAEVPVERRKFLPALALVSGIIAIMLTVVSILTHGDVQNAVSHIGIVTVIFAYFTMIFAAMRRR
jgi:hypothetical protein